MWNWLLRRCGFEIVARPKLIRAAEVLEGFPGDGFVLIPDMIGHGRGNAESAALHMDALTYLAYSEEFSDLGLTTTVIAPEQNSFLIMPKWKGFVMVEAVRRALGLSGSEVAYAFAARSYSGSPTPRLIALRLREIAGK